MQLYIQHYTAPLGESLKKNHIFYWDDNTNTVFQKLKIFISKAHSTSLQYYQRDLSITAQADASKYAMENCLLQHDKPIDFTPKSLMDAEIWNASFKSELLVTIFNTYLYSHSTVEMDKPFEMITLKNLNIMP